MLLTSTALLRLSSTSPRWLATRRRSATEKGRSRRSIPGKVAVGRNGKRGGKGGRNGGGQKDDQDDDDEPVTIHAGTYSKKDWYKLGAEGQNKVRALRKKKQEKEKEKKRKIKELQSQREDEDDDDNEEEAQPQFGRGAHKKGKKGDGKH